MKKRVYKAKNDNEFLNQLAFIIFVAGFRYKLVEELWPLMEKAFQKFNVGKVAEYTEKDVERVMKAKGMVKNKAKIEAIVENARICRQLQEEYGSVLARVEEAKRNEKEGVFHKRSLQEAFREFKRIGPTTSG